MSTPRKYKDPRRQALADATQAAKAARQARKAVKAVAGTSHAERAVTAAPDAAAAYRAWMEVTKETQTACAKHFGVSRQAVWNALNQNTHHRLMAESASRRYRGDPNFVPSYRCSLCGGDDHTLPRCPKRPPVED